MAATESSSFNQKFIASDKSNQSSPIIQSTTDTTTNELSPNNTLMVPRNNALFSCKSPARIIIQAASKPQIENINDKNNENFNQLKQNISKSNSSGDASYFSAIDNNNNNKKSFTRSNAKSASNSYSATDIEIETMATTTITQNDDASDSGELLTMTTEIPLSVPDLEKYKKLTNADGIIINGDIVLDTIEKDILDIQENFVKTVNRNITFQDSLRQSIERAFHCDETSNSSLENFDQIENIDFNSQKNNLNKSASAIDIPINKIPLMENNLNKIIPLSSTTTPDDTVKPQKFQLQKNLSLPSMPNQQLQQQQILQQIQSVDDNNISQEKPVQRKRVRTPQLGEKVGVSLKRVTPPRSKIQLRNQQNPLAGVVLKRVERKPPPMKSILDDDKPLYHFSIVRSKNDDNSKQQQNSKKPKSNAQAPPPSKNNAMNKLPPKNLHANYDPKLLAAFAAANKDGGGNKATTSGNMMNINYLQTPSIKSNFLVSTGKPSFPSAKLLSPPKPKLVTIEKIEGDKIVIIKKLVVPKNCKIPPETLKKQIAALMAAEQAKVFI